MIGPLPPDLYGDAVALWHEVGLTRPWNDPVADLERAVSSPSSCVLAAVSDSGDLLGTAMVGHDGHRGWMYYLAVSASARRTGLGQALVVACEEWVTARGIPKLMLMVRSSNRDVLGFYAAVGYTAEDTKVMSRRLG